MPDTITEIQMTLSRLETVLKERCAHEHEAIAQLKADNCVLRDRVERLNGRIIGLSSLVTVVITLLTHLLFNR
jgi:hypothetical protein